MTTVTGLSNDNFANAFVLTGLTGDVTGNSTGATCEPTEPYYQFDPNYATVWFSWTAPATGSTVVDMAGSGYDVFADIFTGTALTNLQYVPGATYEFFNNLGKTTFNAVAGTTYYFMLAPSGSVNTLTGPYHFVWTQVASLPPSVFLDTFDGTAPLAGHVANSGQTWSSMGHGIDLISGYATSSYYGSGVLNEVLSFVDNFDFVFDIEIIASSSIKTYPILSIAGVGGASNSFIVGQDNNSNGVQFGDINLPYGNAGLARGRHTLVFQFRGINLSVLYDGLPVRTGTLAKPGSASKTGGLYVDFGYGFGGTFANSVAISRAEIVLPSSAFWMNFVKCLES